MITVVPVLMPVTIPVPGFTVAMAVLLLLHVAAPDASVRANEKPGHTGVLPVIADGKAITVTVAVAIQPVPSAYVILVVPNDTPVTDPEGLIVATEVVLLTHDVPPGVASERKVTPPVHTAMFPNIGPGNGLTLIVRVTRQPVPRV